MAESTTAEIEADRIGRPRPVSPCTTKLKGQKVEYSHRLAEKRRRDRMNISISEIAQLLPASSVTKQLEKAEILEKTISYIKKLQGLTGESKTGSETVYSEETKSENATEPKESKPATQSDMNSKYYNGFTDCTKEVFHCLTTVEAMDLEQPCFRRLMQHLQNELQVMSEQVERSGSEDNHKDNQNLNFLSGSSNGSIRRLSLSKSMHDSWQCKRTHENSESPGNQNKPSSEEPASKKVREDSEKNSCSDFHGGSFSLGAVSSSLSKEKRKVTLDKSCTWDGNGASHSSNSGGSSAVSEKEKEALPSSFKNDSGNMYDRANIDGGGYGPCNGGMNCKWPSHGLDTVIQATPISPRTPYIPSPYTVPTYALHPSGTHYIPVVLHLSIPLPPFAETNGRLNPLPNGYFGALNYMRMGYPHFPYFPGFPFASQLNGIKGMNGGQNPKDELRQKQCQPKPRDPDSSNVGHEHPSMNVCPSQDLLSSVD